MTTSTMEPRAELLRLEGQKFDILHQEIDDNVRVRMKVTQDANTKMINSLREDFLDYRAEFKTFRKQVETRFDAVDQRFDGMDQRFDGMDQRFGTVDKRFNGVDQRLDGMNETLQEILRRLPLVK